MLKNQDTSLMRGGPLRRYGGKGQIAHRLLPHFARAAIYVEPFFGAGGMFFRLPAGLYCREAVNDLDRAIVTFFEVLRTRPDELIRACSLSPHARDEFTACLEHSDDPLEEARRVWVRSRQGFGGESSGPGKWRRSPGDTNDWCTTRTETKLHALDVYAARLRHVIVDNIDGAEFVARWGHGDTFVYSDPTYPEGSRSRADNYRHEMDDAAHARLAAAHHEAVERGCKVAVSGYHCDLYDALYRDWRHVELDVALHAAREGRGRRTEVLWCSYPETEAWFHESEPLQLSLDEVSRGGAPLAVKAYVSAQQGEPPSSGGAASSPAPAAAKGRGIRRSLAGSKNR